MPIREFDEDINLLLRRQQQLRIVGVLRRRLAPDLQRRCDEDRVGGLNINAELLARRGDRSFR